MKVHKETQYQDLDPHVFTDWMEDTEDTNRKVLEFVLKQWKINRITKDQEAVKEVEEVCWRYIKQLKELYISLISDSGFPYLTWLDFANFIKQINVVDERTPLATIDRIFIAANVEEAQVQENPDRALCRHEFFEILLRIAAHKFTGQPSSKNFPSCETLGEALEKLLLDHVLKYTMPYPWQEFRDEELWVRDVNLVFDQNVEPLRRLYRKSFTIKEPYLTYQDAVNMISRDSGLEISYKDAVRCYGLSKMTVKNEQEKGVANPYKKMLFVEFLEYIGRIAQEKYKASSQPLYIKIEKVLDVILTLVGSTRKEIQRRVEVTVEESDESVIMEENERMGGEYTS